MHTDSSASRTCFRSRSAMEWTATVRIPNSRQARRIRNAISPRLAMRTLVSIGPGRRSGHRAGDGAEGSWPEVPAGLDGAEGGHASVSITNSGSPYSTG